MEGIPGLFYNWPVLSFFYCELKTLKENLLGHFPGTLRKSKKKLPLPLKILIQTDWTFLSYVGPPPLASIPKTTEFHFTENLNWSVFTSQSACS